MTKNIYFVCSDIHSYYSIFINELIKQGFDKTNKNHYLIICGDLFDRGDESKELLEWVLDFNKTGRLIFIKGNHEQLLLDCLEELKNNYSISLHHLHNGTINTIVQLTDYPIQELLIHNYDYSIIEQKLKSLLDLIDNAKNYYELDKYIFVHGWVPYTLQDSYDPTQKEGEFSCVMVPEIKLDAEDFMWKHAAWYNGMLEWHKGIKIPNKIIVCGHWHTSFGNYNYHNIGSGEFEEDSSFEPFIDECIIALDSCVAFSNKINVLKLEI